MIVPAPSFAHVLAMCDGIGMFEHADHDRPRPRHGYCTDDVARLLLVVAREPRPTPAVAELAHTALRFLADAQGTDGRVHNRRAVQGHWEDRRSVEDCWGRSLWAFGTAARRSPEPWVRTSALAWFVHGAAARSPWPRAMAFGALGAAEVLALDPHHLPARQLLADAVTTIGPIRADDEWPWPEPRLSYANAALPEALLVAGELLERPALVDDGLRLLRWLLDRETLGGHLSPTAVGGAGPADRAPAFDQQPIEVAAMADACARAATVTGDPSWLDGLGLAIQWFAGDNDAGAVMWDPDTGGGYDGLQAWGPNLNQGAESTLALLATLQHARRLSMAPG